MQARWQGGGAGTRVTYFCYFFFQPIFLREVQQNKICLRKARRAYLPDADLQRKTASQTTAVEVWAGLRNTVKITINSVKIDFFKLKKKLSENLLNISLLKKLHELERAEFGTEDFRSLSFELNFSVPLHICRVLKYSKKTDLWKTCLNKDDSWCF